VSVRLDWLGSAEGLGSDARGALTVIGFAPNSFTAQAMPGLVQVVLLAVIEDDGEPQRTLTPGSQMTVWPEIVAPNHDVVLAGQIVQPVLSLPQDLESDEGPVRVTVAMQTALNIRQAGLYRVRLRAQVREKGEMLERATVLRFKVAPGAGPLSDGSPLV